MSFSLTDTILKTIPNLPWLEIAAQAWHLSRKLWQGLADEGLYEVLSYESRLVLQDEFGRHAQFSKREKVRYQQNHIIAYQDHAWGDGEILQDYTCTPGVVVDCYRPGQRTFLLISLREAKKRGDEDEFQMEWGIKNGFKRNHELWETEIRHRTKQMTIQLVFPGARPPKRVWVSEVLHRRRHLLSDENKVVLFDGSIQISWHNSKPRLNERYQFHWEW